jgi:hypothetical protein
MRSYLSKHQPRQPWGPDEIRDRAGEAWRRHGVLLVRIDDLQNDFERQFVSALGDKLYGRRDGSRR